MNFKGPRVGTKLSGLPATGGGVQPLDDQDGALQYDEEISLDRSLLD
ncbi:hypothetical protein J2W14_004061 [Pseudarthrobacter oxydans]|nr:hypothetical protein [Pseudarthrobacter oxydans]